MDYYFDYGFIKDRKWLDGQHKKEQYSDGKQALARYIEIQRNGKKLEEEMKASGMLPDGNRFFCTLDIFHNGEYNLSACLAFHERAFNELNKEHKKNEKN